ELIREGRFPANLDYQPILKMMSSIVESAKGRPFEQHPPERRGWDWIGHWDTVQFAMGDLLQQLMRSEGARVEVKRETYLRILEYLLTLADPSSSDEELATAGHKTKKPG